MDITIDGTGDGSIESLSAKIAGYRIAGHKIEAHYVTSSIEEAIARAERTRDKIPGVMSARHDQRFTPQRMPRLSARRRARVIR